MFIKIQNGSLLNTDHIRSFYKLSRNVGDSDVMEYAIAADGVHPSVPRLIIATFNDKSELDVAFDNLEFTLEAHQL